MSSDKVVTKLAAMAARERAGSKEPEKSAETVAEQTAEVEQEPTDDEDILVAAPVP